jgi:hypothetical protein
MDLTERFLAKITTDERTGCWLWTGYVMPNGYAQFNIGRRHIYAHRWAYERWVGPIPEGAQIDHVRERGCVHRHCANPAHLEPVSNRENAKRGRWGRTTHCPAGHPYDETNTYIIPGTGARQCRECKRDAHRRETERRRGARANA